MFLLLTFILRFNNQSYLRIRKATYISLQGLLLAPHSDISLRLEPSGIFSLSYLPIQVNFVSNKPPKKLKTYIIHLYISLSSSYSKYHHFCILNRKPKSLWTWPFHDYSNCFLILFFNEYSILPLFLKAPSWTNNDLISQFMLEYTSLIIMERIIGPISVVALSTLYLLDS